jgi:hypothetical protein
MSCVGTAPFALKPFKETERAHAVSYGAVHSMLGGVSKMSPTTIGCVSCTMDNGPLEKLTSQPFGESGLISRTVFPQSMLTHGGSCWKGKKI